MGERDSDWHLGRCESVFDEQIISLVFFTSTWEGDNNTSVDRALNNKIGQHSPALHHLPNQEVALAVAAIHNYFTVIVTDPWTITDCKGLSVFALHCMQIIYWLGQWRIVYLLSSSLHASEANTQSYKAEVHYSLSSLFHFICKI